MTDQQCALIDEVEFWTELLECKKQSEPRAIIQRMELALKLASQKLEAQLIQTRTACTTTKITNV